MTNRPYFKSSTAELSEIAENNQDDEIILQAILDELKHRTKRKAKELGLHIAKRLVELATDRVLSLATQLTQDVELFVPTAKEPKVELYSWQKDALYAWQKNNRRGIVEAVTGSGKTRLAIQAIEDQLNEGEKTAVVVPTIELLRQWKQVLQATLPGVNVGLWGDGSSDSLDLCDVLVATVHSASNYYVAPHDSKKALLVADEVHRFAANKFRLALEERFSRRLGLSATWQRPDGKHRQYLEPYFSKIVYSLDFRAAVKQDVISRFRIAAIGVDLSPDERLDYDDATRRLGKYQRKLVSKYGAPEDSFEAFMAWIHGAMQGEIPGAGKEAGMYWSALQKRHRLLSECQGKIETALALDSVIRQSNGAICFTLTINAANDLAEGWHEVGVKAAALHSAVDREERRVVFDDFRNKKVDVVVAAKVLDEGIDVPDADLAIIFATSASPIQLIQRYGRVLRKSSTGREARIAHLYVKDTMEDPTRGRRREAFSDIFDAADDVEYFDAAEDFDEAARYLATFRGL